MRRLLLAAALAAAPACHHDAAAPVGPVPVANNAQPPAPHKVVSDLQLLPVDADMVVGIDVAQVQHSALWQAYIGPRLGAIPGLDKFRAVCGFDPLSSLQSVVFGVGHLDDPEPVGRLVLHGYDHKRAMSCFDKEIGDAEKDGSKLTIDGEVARITDASGKHVAFTFVNDTTAVLVFGPDAARLDKVQHIAEGEGGGLDGSPAFRELYGAIDTHRSLWLLVNGNAPSIAKSSAQMGMHLKALFGSVQIASGVDADLRLRVASPDEANGFAVLMKSQVGNPQIQQFFDKLDISAEAADVKVSVAMSDQKIAQFVTLLGLAGAGNNAPPP